MKMIQKAFVVLALIAAACGISHAQATLSSTTLSQAVSDGVVRTYYLASVTGITAQTTQVNTELYIDAELDDVITVNTTAKTVTVARGVGGTRSVSHLSGATVYLSAPNTAFIATPKTGSCVAANELTLPQINYVNGYTYDCDASGQWGIKKSLFFPGNTCGASTTGTAGAGNNTIVLDGTASALKVASTAAGASHNVFTCYINTDSSLFAGRAGRITDITFLYSQQGSATGLSMIAPLVDSFTPPVPGTSETASSATLTTGACGTLTVTPVIASANLTAISAGQYYSANIACGTPPLLSTEKPLVLIVEFDQSGSTVTTITTPGFYVHYTEFPEPGYAE